MKKLNKKSILIAVIVAFIAVGLVVCIFKVVEKNKSNDGEGPVKEVVDNMDDYGYSLRSDATSYYKELYNELKDLLKEKDFEEKEYAKLVAELFTADLFNIDNKLSNSDIGGKQFVYKDFVNDYTKVAQQTLYRNVLSNIEGDRDQELPIVKLVSIIDVKTAEFTYNDKKDSNAYNVNLNIEYEKDLGYPKSYNVILIHSNDKIEVAKSFGN